MPVLHSTCDVSATPDAVWELQSDVARYPEWVVPADEILAQSEPPMHVGSTYHETGGVSPFKGTSRWTVTEFDAPRRQVHEGDDGKVRVHLTIEIVTTEGGARVSQRVQLTPRGFIVPIFYLIWPLFMRRRSQAALDQTNANMKRRLEASP